MGPRASLITFRGDLNPQTPNQLWAGADGNTRLQIQQELDKWFWRIVLLSWDLLRSKLIDSQNQWRYQSNPTLSHLLLEHEEYPMQIREHSDSMKPDIFHRGSTASLWCYGCNSSHSGSTFLVYLPHKGTGTAKWASKLKLIFNHSSVLDHWDSLLRFKTTKLPFFLLATAHKQKGWQVSGWVGLLCPRLPY